MAMRIEFLAWHSVRPLKDRDIARRIADIEGFYPHDDYDFHVHTGRDSHTGLALWFPRIAGLAPIAGPTGGALAVATHPPFGITDHVTLSGLCMPAQVLALHEKVRSEPRLIRGLATPLILAHLAADGGLHIHNDLRGFAELYQHRADGLDVWSNRLAMPLLFAGVEPVESYEAAQLRGVYSYYPHEHTPFANVERLLGGASVFAGDWPGAPVIHRHNHLLEMLGEAHAQQGQPIDSEACRDALARMAGELHHFWNGPLRCGLTGGRDSRTILATLIAAGRATEVELSTIKILKQDYAVAADLVEACRANGHDVTWKLVERTANGYSASNNPAAWAAFPAARQQRQTMQERVKGWFGHAKPVGASDYLYQCNPLLDRLVFQFHRMDGQTMPAGYYQAPVCDRPSDRVPMLLGGQSGEILRASQYATENLAAGAEDRLWRRARGRFRTGNAPRGPIDRVKPYPRDVHARAHAAWERYFNEAKSGGIDSFLMFDYLNVVAQQSRRVDVPKQLRLICFLSHPTLLRESYKLTPAERIESAMPMRLIGMLAPFLLNVPFAHQIPIETTEVRLDMTGKPQFWDAAAIPGWSGILADTSAWDDAFHAPSILAEFAPGATPELNAYQRDTIAGLLAWRVAHRAYVRVLSRYITGRRNRYRLAA